MFTIIRIVFKLVLVVFLFPFWFLVTRKRKEVTAEVASTKLSQEEYWEQEATLVYHQIKQKLEELVLKDCLYSDAKVAGVCDQHLSELSVSCEKILDDLKSEIIWIKWALSQHESEMSPETTVFLKQMYKSIRKTLKYRNNHINYIKGFVKQRQ